MMVLVIKLSDISNGLLVCFGQALSTKSNNCTALYPIAYNQIFTIVLGQYAPTNSDSLRVYWDTSIATDSSTTALHLWARQGQTPGYSWLVLGI